MAQLQKNQVHTVTVTGYTAEGLGVARAEGQVVFIHGGVRGEVCAVRILKVLKNVAYGRVEEILTRSPARREPDCPHYPACGGCDFRHISYEEELEAKRQRVEDALRRIGGAEIPVEEILGSQAVDGYRNKCQFPVSPEGRAGFYRARSHDVVPAADCRLQAEQANAVARAVEAYLREEGVPAYDERTRRGLLRHIYVRTSREGRALVCLVVNGEALPREAALVERIRAACPETAGVVLNTNDRDTNVVLGERYRTLWGEDTLTDTLCGLRFRLSVPSFYQVNRAQAERLYGKAREFAGLTGRETVLDLYCGAGTITLVAGRAGRGRGDRGGGRGERGGERPAQRRGKRPVPAGGCGGGRRPAGGGGAPAPGGGGGPAPEGAGGGGHCRHRRYGPRAGGVRLLRSGDAGTGPPALRGGGLPGGPGRGGGPVPQNEACGDGSAAAERDHVAIPRFQLRFMCVETPQILKNLRRFLRGAAKGGMNPRRRTPRRGAVSAARLIAARSSIHGAAPGNSGGIYWGSSPARLFQVLQQGVHCA